MGNVNKVFLMGNLTRDPELRYLPSGTAVVDFGLAVNRSYKKQNGELQEETTFVDISMFGRRAEVINQYFSKGSPIFIEGRLKFESWQGNDGQNRSKLKVVARNFEFVGGGQRQQGGGGGNQSYQPVGSGSRSQSQGGGYQNSGGGNQGYQGGYTGNSGGGNSGAPMEDDDVPF